MRTKRSGGLALLLNHARALFEGKSVRRYRAIEWRLCFRWTERGVEDVEIVDYH